jgi:hypothetical protein
MSAVDTCFELGAFAPAISGGSDWPVHCATEMEMVIPSVGATAVGYSFEPEEGPDKLPPVWRCGCGFQLDAWAIGWPDFAEEPPTPERLPNLTCTVGG